MHVIFTIFLLISESRVTTPEPPRSCCYPFSEMSIFRALQRRRRSSGLNACTLASREDGRRQLYLEDVLEHSQGKQLSWIEPGFSLAITLRTLLLAINILRLFMLFVHRVCIHPFRILCALFAGE